MSNSTSISADFAHNSDDKRPLPEIIADFAHFPLAYHDVENTRYYAVQDWIAGVAQSSQPRVLWAQIKKRLKKAAGVELFHSVKQLAYRAADGKSYKMDHASAEVLYQITQRMDANTGIRDRVLNFLANAGVVLDEMRIDPDKAIAAAIAEYQRQGKSDAWIKARLISVGVRIFFTEAFANSQKVQPSSNQFARITDTMRMGVWKRSTKTIREQLGLNKDENVRNNLTILGLVHEIEAEQLSAMALEPERNLSFAEADAIVRDNSEFVGKRADEMSKKLGIDLITNKPLIEK